MEKLSKKVEKMFWKYLKTSSWFAWIKNLINIPITVITARLTALVISDATNGNVQKVFIQGILLLSIVLGAKFLNIFMEIMYEKQVAKSCHYCKMELYSKFFQSPIHMLYASKHGDTLEHFEDDFATISGKYLNLYPEFGTSVITVIVYFLLLFGEQKALAFVFLGISILQLLPPWITKKYFRANYDANRETEARVTDFICSGYQGFETIKLYGLKSWFLDKLKVLHKQELLVGGKSEATFRIELMMEDFVSKILTYGSYMIAGLFVLYNKTSLEIGIQAIALAPGLFGAVKTIFSQLPHFAQIQSAQNRLMKWFSTNTNQEQLIENEKIIFEDVSFSFKEKKILEHVSLKIDMTKLHVLKGKNGIGKSTLFHLMLGLLPCETGEIALGAVHPTNLSAKNFPEKLFYIPQEDAEFDFTPNELFQMLECKHIENIKKIAIELGLQKEILSQTQISELSGGERKKVYLALGFGINPKFMLLDEPTNSLDETGKLVLKQLLKKYSGGAMIITHENYFDDIADCNYVLNDGGWICEKAR